MKQLYFIFVLAFICLANYAQTPNYKSPLKPSLKMVKADSVFLYDFFWDNLRTEALKIDTSLEPISFEVTQEDYINYPKLKEEWEQEILPQINLIGSLTDMEKTNPTESSIFVLKKALKLYLLTGNAHYYETIDRILTNSIRSGLSQNDPYATRLLAAQEAVSAPGYFFATDDKGFYINNYYNGYSNIVWNNSNKVRLECSASYPWRGFLNYHVYIKEGSPHFKIRIRVPYWAQDKIELSKYKFSKRKKRNRILINGSEIDYKKENGYIVIDRTWKNDDELTLDFKLYVHQVQDKRNLNNVALQYGPLVYSVIDISQYNNINAFQPFYLKFDLEHYKAKLIHGYLNNENKNKEKHPLFAPYYVLRKEHKDFTPVWLTLQK